MNLGLFRREHLQSGDPELIGSATADQFQRTHGALMAWQEVEHTDDGHHTDITATGIVVDPGSVIVPNGSVSTGGNIYANNGLVVIGDQPSEGTPPSLGGYGIKFNPWRIVADRSGSGAPSALMFQYLTEPLGDYLFRFIRNTTYDWTLHALTGIAMRLGSIANRLASVDALDVNGVRVNVGAGTSAPNRTQLAQNATLGAVTIDAPLTGVSHNTIDVGVTSQRPRRAYFGEGIYDWNRAIAQGVWTTIPNASMTFATAAGPFFVGASSIARYMLTGKTVSIIYDFSACNVPAAAGNLLTVNFPGTLGWNFAFAGGQQPCGRTVDAGATVPSFAQVASANGMHVFRHDFGNWGPTANGTYLSGLFVAPIL